MPEEAEVSIKQRVSAEGHPFSEVFIDYEGRRFYSRYWYTLSDTPHSRANERSQFMRRLQRFPRA